MGKRPLHGNSVPAVDPESTPAWQYSQRFSRLSLRIPHMLVDLSKNLIDQTVLENLLGLAEKYQRFQSTFNLCLPPWQQGVERMLAEVL